MSLQQILPSRFFIENIDTFIHRQWAVKDDSGVIYATGSTPEVAMSKFRQDYPSMTNAGNIPTHTYPSMQEAKKSMEKFLSECQMSKGIITYTDTPEQLKNIVQRKDAEIKRLQETLEASDNYAAFERLKDDERRARQEVVRLTHLIHDLNVMAKHGDLTKIKEVLTKIKEVLVKEDDLGGGK